MKTKSEASAPIISVIVPVYNRERQLPACLRTLCTQTLADWECILVDDGSTDGTPAACDVACAADSRFRALHQPNSGAAAARNTGLAAARGEWVTFLDSDDFLEPQYLETLLNGAHDTNDIVGPLVRCFADGQTAAHTSPEGDYAPAEYARAVLLKQIDFLMAHAICCKLYRRRFLEKNALRMDVRCPRGEDAVFNLDCICRCRGVRVQGGAAYRYQIGGASLTARFTPDVPADEKALLEATRRMQVHYALNSEEEQGAMRLLCYETFAWTVNTLRAARLPAGAYLRTLVEILSLELLSADELMQVKGGGKRWELLAAILRSKNAAALALWLKTTAL